MNIGICDDNIVYLDAIELLLEPYKRQEAINISRFSSGEEFLESIEKGAGYDIVFLDIEMKGASGIDVARRIRDEKSNAIIFFITSYVNYVSDTFRLGAFQFLLKPINEEVFRCDFERALKEHKSRHEQYMVRWRNENYLIEYGEIYYIEAYNRHLFVHTESNSYECVGRLDEETDRLKGYNFVRCHQGYLVNLEKIREINSTTIVLKNKQKIPVSRNQKDIVMEELNMYLLGRLI